MPQIKIQGMIDPHTHLRDLDWSHKATFASETKAAIAGGYWAVFDMPNTAPSTIDDARLTEKLARIDKQAHCDFGLYFGASQADNSAEYERIAGRVCGLKIYNNSTTGDLLIDSSAMRERHYRAWTTNRLIAVHAEGATVANILDLVRKYRQPTHFLHISSEYEINLLTQAKRDGLPITVGVCPHHLFLSEDDLPSLGGFGRMKPELKRKSDQRALWRAIRLGVVDIIESDHAPHTRAEKQAEPPASGVPGLETTLPLLMQAVKDGRLPLQQACDMVSLNVQRIWRITPLPKTYTLVDTDQSFVIDGRQLRSKCGWSPFEGMRVCGKVLEVWIRGHQVYDGENVLCEAGFGRNLFGFVA
ncbi:MAG: dihydroorotase family protein [Chloroflexota bacterium]|nr:dihydroorotase family protein [Chloroflexota bacterium]